MGQVHALCETRSNTELLVNNQYTGKKPWLLSNRTNGTSFLIKVFFWMSLKHVLYWGITKVTITHIAKFTWIARKSAGIMDAGGCSSWIPEGEDLAGLCTTVHSFQKMWFWQSFGMNALISWKNRMTNCGMRRLPVFWFTPITPWGSKKEWLFYWMGGLTFGMAHNCPNLLRL